MAEVIEAHFDRRVLNFELAINCANQAANDLTSASKT